jgi:hypothetical protein
MSEIWQAVNKEGIFFFSSIINKQAVSLPDLSFAEEVKAQFPQILPSPEMKVAVDTVRKNLVELLRSIIEPDARQMITEPDARHQITAVHIIGDLVRPLGVWPSISFRRLCAFQAKAGGFYDYKDEKDEAISIDDVVASNSPFIILADFAKSDG